MAIPLLIDDRCQALAFRPLSCPCPGVRACPRCPTAIDKIDIIVTIDVTDTKT